MKLEMMVLMAVLGVSAMAQDPYTQTRGWFGGVTFGQAELDEKIFDDGDVISDNSDDRDSSLGIFTGFMFSRYFGLETGYMNFGSMYTEEGTRRVELDVQGFKFMVVGRLPIGSRIALVGKAGAFHSDIDEKVLVDGTQTFDDNDDDVGHAFEAGVHFKLTPRLTGLVEVGNYNLSLVDFRFEHNHDDDEYDFEINGVERDIFSVHAGLKYRF